MFETFNVYFEACRPAVTEAVEIILLTVLFYYLLRMLRKTAGIFVFASFVAIIGGLAVISALSRMTVLATLSNRIITQLPLVAIVLFQQDLRRFLTLLSNRRTFDSISKSRLISQERQLVQINDFIQNITQAVCALTTLPEWRAYLTDGLSRMGGSHLTTENTGALIAIEGRQGLDEYIERGVKLDCEAEQHLLRTIFYNGTPLHDGGIIIRRTRIVAASCQFPAAHHEFYEAVHTRHNAAVGLSSQSDALVIVVSEETGRVSVAQGNSIERISTPPGLIKVLEARYGLARNPEDSDASDGQGGLLKRMVNAVAGLLKHSVDNGKEPRK